MGKLHTATLFALWRATENIGPLKLGHLPNALIIGAQRAGTTSFFRYLRQHRMIAPSARKEVHFFDANSNRGPNWYQVHFTGRGAAEKVKIEATPYYIFHPLVAERVRQQLPEARFIVLLRDPVERAYSHYSKVRANGKETLSFASAIAAEDERLAVAEADLASGRIERSSAHKLYSYTRRGLYADQIERWLEHFPLERFKFVISEDLFEQPAQNLNEVCAFLGLPNHPWKNLHNRKKRIYDKMDEEVRVQLANYFAPHNKRLEKILGRRLKW